MSGVASISAWADSPLIANKEPPDLMRWRTIGNNLGSGATAREVTTSKEPLVVSAFPRITVIWSLRFSSVTTSLRKSTLLWRGSTKVTWVSGLAKAITMPGSPAPEPISTTEDPWGIEDWGHILQSQQEDIDQRPGIIEVHIRNRKHQSESSCKQGHAEHEDQQQRSLDTRMLAKDQ